MFFQEFRLEKEFIVQEKRGNLEEHELHAHDVLEFHVLLEHEAVFRLPDRQYEGLPGDVFLFRPSEPHWNLAKDARRPIRWISILFSPSIVRRIPNGYKLLAPFYAAHAVSPHIPASTPAARAIHELAASAVAEEKAQAAGWEPKQFAAFVDILVHTFRHAMAGAGGGGPNPAAEAIDEGIVRAIEYMLEHFTEPADIEPLVRLTGKRRTHFYRRFKAVTGVTPNRFLHRLRMQAAAYLLRHSNRSITDIAFDCGYASLPYFNKHFKDNRGMSPRAYRESAAT